MVKSGDPVPWFRRLGCPTSRDPRNQSVWAYSWFNQVHIQIPARKILYCNLDLSNNVFSSLNKCGILPKTHVSILWPYGNSNPLEARIRSSLDFDFVSALEQVGVAFVCKSVIVRLRILRASHEWTGVFASVKGMQSTSDIGRPIDHNSVGPLTTWKRRTYPRPYFFSASEHDERRGLVRIRQPQPPPSQVMEGMIIVSQQPFRIRSVGHSRLLYNKGWPILGPVRFFRTHGLEHRQPNRLTRCPSTRTLFTHRQHLSITDRWVISLSNFERLWW